MKIFTVVCSLIIIIIPGCFQMPVTDGFRDHDSPDSAITLVLGNNPVVVNNTVTWLQKRGLSIVDSSRIRSPHDGKMVSRYGFRNDRTAVIEAVKSSDIEIIVLADQIGQIRSPMVSIHAIDVNTSKIIWTGNARYERDHKYSSIADVLADLTCHALATAWNFRPPGRRWFLSSESVCTAAEN